VIKGLKGFGLETSGSDRIELLELGMTYLLRSPLVGLGIYNFGSFSGNFFSVGPHIFNYSVHNAFVQVATELGIFGGVLFLGMVAFLMIHLVMVLWSKQRIEDKWIFKGFLMGWMAIMIHMMSEPMAYSGTLWMIMGLIEGSCLTLLRKKTESVEIPLIKRL